MRLLGNKSTIADSDEINNIVPVSSFVSKNKLKQLSGYQRQAMKDTVLSRKEDFVRDHFSHYAAD